MTAVIRHARTGKARSVPATRAQKSFADQLAARSRRVAAVSADNRPDTADDAPGEPRLQKMCTRAYNNGIRQVTGIRQERVCTSRPNGIAVPDDRKIWRSAPRSWR